MALGLTILLAKAVVKPASLYQLKVPTLQLPLKLELPPAQILLGEALTELATLGIAVTLIVVVAGAELQPDTVWVKLTV